MRRLLVGFAAVLLVGALLAWLMQQESGYLLLVVGNTSVEMNLWAALVALLLVTLVVRLVWRLLSSLKIFGRWRQARLDKHRALTAHGLLQFIEGRWDLACRTLTRAAPKSDMPLVNYLAAANAAFESGDTESVHSLLAKATQVEGDSEFAVGITQARLHIKAGCFEEALANLKRLHKQDPEHPCVLSLLQQTYRAVGDWDSLYQLLPELRRRKIYDKERFIVLEEEVYSARLTNLAQRAAHKPGGSAGDELSALWDQMPGHIRRSTPVVAAYSDYLQRLGDGERAEKLLRKTLNAHWDDKLVRRYGFVTGADVSAQMVVAEAWLRERPNNPELLLALGRLAQHAELWGKARDYLESSLALSGHAETYAELARLMAQLGDPDKSAEYYRRGLLQKAES